MSRIYKRGDIYWGAWSGLDGKPRRESLHTENYKAAKLRLGQRESETSIRAVAPVTVLDLVMRAAQVQVDKGNSQDWRERCEKMAEQYLIPLLGAGTNLNIEDADELGDIFKEYARTRRTMPTHKGTLPSDATIRKEVLVIHQGARDLGNKFAGDTDAIVPDFLVESAPRDVWLTREQAGDLRRYVTPHRWDWIGFAIHTGIDIGPVHRIDKARDVDFSQGEFGAVHTRDTKTKFRDRWVPLSADARAIVDRRMQTPHEMLFWPVWTSSQVRESMLRWCPAAGLEERIVWKDLRRSFCSWMCQAGVPMHHVIRLMGHGSSQMVQRVYMHLAPETFEQAIAKLPSVPPVYMDNVVPIEKHWENRGDVEEGRAESAY